MKKSLLKEVILGQEQERNRAEPSVRRTALDLALKYVLLPHAVIVSGIRRCGKSTLLRQIFEEYYHGGVYCLNFEDERLLDFTVEDFNDLYEAFLELYGERKVFFFDEIQNVPRWESFVRRMQSQGCKFFLTGSNASLLSKELGTKLTGRNIGIELFPFSFAEFLTFHGIHFSDKSMSLTSERASLKKYFADYLRHGGMPEYLKHPEPALLRRVYEDILYRDIAARHSIRRVKSLRELGMYLISNLGATFSYHNLAKVLGVRSAVTIQNFTTYFEDSYLFFLVGKFSYSLKRQLSDQKKVYCIDNGLAESVAFQFSKNKGKFLENLVFLELRRRFSEIYYYKTSNDMEVDFLTKSGRNHLGLIQVTEHMDHEKTRRREVDALLKAMDELRLQDALILTDDTQESIRQGGKSIIVRPIYQWLLDSSQTPE